MKVTWIDKKAQLGLDISAAIFVILCCIFIFTAMFLILINSVSNNNAERETSPPLFSNYSNYELSSSNGTFSLNMNSSRLTFSPQLVISSEYCKPVTCKGVSNIENYCYECKSVYQELKEDTITYAEYDNTNRTKHNETR
jgi:hypothetical protein